TMMLISAFIIVAVLAVATREGGSRAGLIESAAAAAPAEAPAPVPPPITFRAVVSSSCAADGCPTTCSSDEALVSAICIGPTSAKFSDRLTVADGQMTAGCGPTSSQIVVSCARK
ncbi:hypothetical protein, partial [Rhodopseudomonas palustris]